LVPNTSTSLQTLAAEAHPAGQYLIEQAMNMEDSLIHWAVTQKTNSLQRRTEFGA
jgi:hypothetical protein